MRAGHKCETYKLLNFKSLWCLSYLSINIEQSYHSTILCRLWYIACTFIGERLHITNDFLPFGS